MPSVGRGSTREDKRYSTEIEVLASSFTIPLFFSRLINRFHGIRSRKRKREREREKLRSRRTCLPSATSTKTIERDAKVHLFFPVERNKMMRIEAKIYVFQPRVPVEIHGEKMMTLKSHN